MPPETPQPPPPPNNPELNSFANAVMAALSGELRRGVVETENLTGADIDRRDAEDNYNFRKAWKKAKGEALCDAMKFSIYLACGCALALFVVMCRYLWLVRDNQEALASLLLNVIIAVLVAGGTLCIEHVFGKKEKN